ncbi:hypothetical protein [Erysipelothrix piscisicarius]|uniref:hypothetical protein n=1 Tax=Erysipelothrix piscisicarius TaxID=2485784 RepID=UPI002F933C03
MEKPVVKDGVDYEAVAYGLSHAEYSFLARHNIPFIKPQSQSLESLAFKVALNPVNSKRSFKISFVMVISLQPSRLPTQQQWNL